MSDHLTNLLVSNESAREDYEAMRAASAKKVDEDRKLKCENMKITHKPKWDKLTKKKK